MMARILELRDHWIYSLGDGRRFVAQFGYGGAYSLYDPRFGIAHPPIYDIDMSGELLSWGARTGWCIEDLLDTGETSPPLDLRGLALL